MKTVRNSAKRILMLASLCGAVAFGQSAALSGRVIDQSGAVVRQAEVTLTGTLTGSVRHAKSNGDGLYIFSFVQSGQYTLTARANGFKNFERTNVVIETAQAAAIDIRLAVGTQTETVTVDGSGININVTDATVSTIVDRQFVDNIPLNGRSLQPLMTVVPGVSVVPSQGTGTGGEISVNGQRTESNYFTINGVSANTGAVPTTPGFGAGFSGSVPGQSALGTTQSMVSLDELQEFRALTSTYSAEYGRVPGGQFTLTTRSGNNSWHGSAFEFLRNGVLNANDWFNNANRLERQAERQNNFGGTLGGPLFIPKVYNGKNKTFFFFSYEGLRLQVPQAATLTKVPSLTLRQQVPAALKPFVNAFPLPNGQDTGDGLAYLTAGYSAPRSLDTLAFRMDQNLSDRWKLFGRYSHAPSNSVVRPAANLAQVSNTVIQVDSGTLGLTGMISSRLTNDFRFNITQNNSGISSYLDNFGGAAPLAVTDVPGLSGSPNNWMLFGFLYASPLPYIYLAPQIIEQRQWNVTDSVSLSLGRHTIKAGIDFRQIANRQELPPTYEYFWANSLQEVQTNNGTPAAQQYSILMAPIYPNFSTFVQDEWRVTPRLSLSLGLRWELNPAPHDAEGKDPYTITDTNLATVRVQPMGTALWKTTYNNWAPRIGMAYQLRQASGSETVLRAGVGKFFDTGNARASTGYYGFGTSASAGFPGPFPLTPAQLGSIPPANGNPPYTGVWGYDPNLKLPYTLQWNATVEQSLGANQTLSVGYVASVGRNLLVQRQYRPLSAGNTAWSGSLYLTDNSATSDYHSLQVKFQRRLSRGLQALASYTWSHAIDEATTNFTLFQLLRSSSDYDLRHNAQVALTYDVPGHYSNRAASALLKGWSIDSRISLRTALPVDVIARVAADPVTASQLNFHPDLVPGQPLYVESPALPGGRRINFNAFVTPPGGVDGNVGRNIARAFDANQFDLAVRRNFTLTERFGLQLRAEAFNAFNTAIFGAVSNSLAAGASLFGTATNTQHNQLRGLNPLHQTGGPRSLQLSLRLQF